MPMEMPWRSDAAIQRRILLSVLAALAATPASAQQFIGGTTPDRRPENAPRIEKFEKSPQWAETATAGVVQPLPPSLKFLDDQGAWFTPFIQPGMTGPYDIRGRHAHAAAPATNTASH